MLSKNKPVGLTSKKTTLHVQHTFFVYFFAVVLLDDNVNQNVQKLPCYKFSAGHFVCVLVHLFLAAAHFHLGGR